MNTRFVLSIITCSAIAHFAYADDREAITALENAGAIVKRDDLQLEKPVIAVTYNLRQVTADGIRALSEIEEISSIEFRGTGDTEINVSTLNALRGKKYLKRFAIANSKISDEAAKVLGTLKGLEVLELRSQIEMSPRGLHEIFKLTNIKELTLSDRLASDYVLENLVHFQVLRRLTIRSVFVSDEGITSLSNLSNLRSLRIFVGPNVSDAGVRRLGEMNLSEMHLTYSDATNEQLKELRKFRGLKSLRLNHAAKITNDAVAYLSELTELTELDISDAHLTKSGIQELKSALPSCKVLHDARKRD